MSYCYRWFTPNLIGKTSNFQEMWDVFGEDVGSRAIFAPCKICMHVIPGVRAAVKPPWTDSPRTFNKVERILV